MKKTVPPRKLVGWPYPLGNRLILNLLLSALPVSMIVWGTGSWLCFFSMVLYNVFFNKENSYINEVKTHYLTPPNSYLLMVYIAYFIFSLGSILLLNSSFSSIENSIIFLMWLAISPMFSMLSPSDRALGYGCLAAVIIAFVIAINQFYLLDIRRPYGMYGGGYSGSGAIKFGDMSVLLGILCLIFLSPSKVGKFGVSGAFIGFVVCLYTGARGGIFALLLGIIVWVCHVKNNKFSLQAILLAVLSSGFVFFALDEIMDSVLSMRIKETVTELFSVFNNNLDTSIGIRLQLWKAALIMFERHPVFGVGLNNFDSNLLLLNKENIISDTAAIYAHAHNEYLCSLATGGIIGFALTCLLFIIPMALFKKDYQENVWAKAGFWSVCLMSFFALTDCMFDRRMTVISFAIFISVCMAGNVFQKRRKLCLSEVGD